MSLILTAKNKELTPIEVALKVDADGRVSSRNIYKFLELDPTHYSRWCKVNIVDNPFATANVDYEVLATKGENILGGRPTMDYHCSIAFAKKLCMLEKNERGEQARDYFIKVEEALKRVASDHREKKELLFAIYSGGQGAVTASKQLVEIEVGEATRPLIETIKDQQPKADFYDTVADSRDDMDVASASKLIGSGSKRVFKTLREHHILNKDNIPYQRYINNGCFRVIEERYYVYGEARIYLKTLVLQKGLDLIRKVCGDKRLEFLPNNNMMSVKEGTP
jgi:phage anti-repressor protein/phage antirepressor YoqD-like protein